MLAGQPAVTLQLQLLWLGDITKDVDVCQQENVEKRG